MRGRYLWSRKHGLVKVPWFALTMTGLALLLAGALGGFWLASYQHGIDGHLSRREVTKMEAYMADYQKRFKKELTTTPGEASVIVQRHDDVRNGREQ